MWIQTNNLLSLVITILCLRLWQALLKKVISLSLEWSLKPKIQSWSLKIRGLNIQEQL